MQWKKPPEAVPGRLCVFPGGFNPPTVAHLALARAALTLADEVLFVLPKRFPHKDYHGAALEERVAMLVAATAGEPRFTVGVAEGGLFIEIADECTSLYQPPPTLTFLCGRDAAERILAWDYGDQCTLPTMLSRFSLLVADRSGHYEPPPVFAPRVSRLPLPMDWTHVSSTEVRKRLNEGREGADLVPQSIRDLVTQIYSGGRRSESGD